MGPPGQPSQDTNSQQSNEFDFGISEAANMGLADISGYGSSDMDISVDLQSFGHTWGSASTSNAGAQPQPRLSSGGLDRGNSTGASTASPESRHRRVSDAPNSQDQSADQNGKDGDGIAPAWSELKTKAGKERKRLPLACIACRRKKIRCSGEKPACKHCLRSRIPCVYKVTTRKAAPRTDYMAMLDKRLKRMEDRVIKIIPKEEQGVVADTGRAMVKPPLPTPPLKLAAPGRKRVAEEAFSTELEEWANIKTATSESKPNSRAEPETTTNKTSENGEHNLLVEGADKLPSSDIQEHLAEVYFDYVYGQSYHLLHKPSFMRRLKEGAVPPVLTLAICAISARFSNHPAVRTEPVFLRGEQWAAPARDIALRKYDTPNITILIVYLLLGLHEFGTCQGGRSWMFGGMAQRMAYALQLHRDLDHDPKRGDLKGKDEGLTFTDREIRRRTMWSCFIMDRFNSSGTDRPVFVSEQYIRAQLPIKEKYFQMEITGPTEDLEGVPSKPREGDAGQLSNPEDNLGVAAYFIRLVAVWGKLIHYLNLGGKDKDKYPMWDENSILRAIQRDAEIWLAKLPAGYVHSPENVQKFASAKMANQFLLMHTLYYQIILFSNCFALPNPGARPDFPKDMPLEFLQNASRAAFESANQISALVKDAMDHLLVAPFAGYCAFFSSTVHMHGAFSKNAAVEASSKQNLAWNVKYLTQIKKYWGMFHFVTENLRDLYRRHADVARNGATSAKEGESAGIFQYGDWFDRYPHGVSGADYEEPSAAKKKDIGADAALGKKSDLQTVEEFFSKTSPKTVHAKSRPQPPQQKKKPRRRQSISTKNSNESQSEHAQKPENSIRPTESHRNASPLPQDMFADSSGVQPYPTSSMSNFPSGFGTNYQHPNFFSWTGPQQIMTQLDRQMVLSSYTGENTGQTDTLETTHTNFDPFNLDAFSGHNANTNTIQSSAVMTDVVGTTSANANVNAALWGDPSTAWFMPFNMAPPTMEDSNIFARQQAQNLAQNNSGNVSGPTSAPPTFDWSNFGGFGDMPVEMPPTGLTPPIGTGTNTGDRQDSDMSLRLDDMEGNF
ncbi:putative transcriptional regulatory protein [Acrodontium crateriforme]|uniref:Transcriptional regulatory protein n=1 Tax=Acrodontium crateriforme TaxID=150365 RepID=A0AAQ3M1S8_9PEZI|nr:putative transcriptional regulatory protein [Acrodontium crateriforme]